MAVHLARYRDNDSLGWGVVAGDKLTPLEGRYHTTADLIANASADWQSALRRTPTVELQEVEVLSPVTTPCRVMCQGANYRQHAIESGMDPDNRAFNVFFDKTDAAVTGPDMPVTRPSHVQLLDYEIELALVIGAEINGPITVTDGDLRNYVFGITIANDVSARDVQLPQGQFLKGKSYRGFCPVGPLLAVLDADEFGQLDDLDLRLQVNGKQRQADNTRNLIYRPAETLTELSQFCNLSPGDLLLTGTPHGCTATSPPALLRRLLTALLPEDKLWQLFISQNKSKPYLTPGDVVTASIRNESGSIDLGTQHTTISAPSPSIAPTR
jgi:2-keto-4-pentenoate hydratase/2-oxohepta-3-ene-1,7-dioic acid hydratase in catechol pathway